MIADPLARAAHDTLEAIPQLAWTAAPTGRAEWYNARWYAYTGQSRADALDDGFAVAINPDDRRAALDAYVAAIAAGEPFAQEYRLRAADGSYRWHAVSAQPLRDGAGRVTRWIGVAADVDARRRAGDAMAFLADAAEMLGAAPDLDTAFGALSKLVVPALADWCSLYLARGGVLVPHTIHHRDPVKRAAAWALVRRYPPPGIERLDPAAAQTIYIPVVDAATVAAAALDARHAAELAAFGFRSLLAVPLVARGTMLGILQLIRDAHRDPFAPGDRDLAVVLAQRAAVVLDNARVADRERRIARTFQEAALPRTLPRLDGLRLDVEYVAGERDAAIGGDWYDAFALRDGRLVVSIGDVAGSGVDAAVLMSSLRQAIRVAAYRALGPAEILRATDEALTAEAPERTATAWVGILDPTGWTLSYASAGHPPALLRSPSGALLELSTGDPPLGAGTAPASSRSVTAIPPGSLLVMYTDGLTEASRDVIEGERRLLELLRDDAVVHAANPARFVRDGVLADAGRDDVAILVVGFGRDAHWAFDAEDAMAAHGARASFVEFLRRDADPASDFGAAELIFGELVGNVVRYAPGPIDIALAWNDERPVLHVLDRGRSFDLAALLPDDVLCESGRGLFIVAALGERLSARALPGRGNHVQVGLPVRRKRAEVEAAASGAKRPRMSDEPAVPHPPYDELRTALGDDAAERAHVDALQAELHAAQPDRAAVAAHATRLRGIPVLEARVANWWDDPETQRWVKAITDAGL